MKRKAIKWSGHAERRKDENKVHLNETEDVKRRGMSLGRQKDKVETYMHERSTGKGGGLEKAKREC